jgi:glycosyltransferase involved in cell wall biosynthesis
MPEGKISLTIITPVFNGEKYIENCLKNVAEQAFEGLEHLIMDGGSSDGTVQIVQSYQDRFSHIRLISEKDRGQSDAMNKGIRAAKGSIIGFLNVDDYYEPDVLRKTPGIFENLSEPAFVCGNLNIWNEDGTLKHFNRPDRISLPELISDKFEWPYNPSAYFYHRSLHDLAGMYDEDNHYCMDYEFILAAAKQIKLQHIDKTWGNFCEVPESKTLIRFSEFHDEAVEAGAQLRKRFIEQLSPSEKADLDKLNAGNQMLDSGKKKGWLGNSLVKGISLLIRPIFK